MSQQVNRYGRRRFAGLYYYLPSGRAVIRRNGLFQGRTDQSTPVFTHKIHYLRGHISCCCQKITFIFTVLVVHYNYKLTIFDVFIALSLIQHVMKFAAKLT